NLPIIKKLIVSSPNGKRINANLDLGGFGISRFFIDNELRKIAIRNGVNVLEETKVNDVVFSNEKFEIKYKNESATCAIVAGCFGKRSNLDIKWARDFIKKKPGKLNNYIGVKYHIKAPVSGDTIALHSFKNGYCGISKVEDDVYCLCYLTTAQNLKSNNSIQEMEQNILHKNPFLKQLFTEAKFLFKEPVTISQINFERKTLVQNHILMLGDAAGMITPLCGNGMSMALHSSKIASVYIDQYLNKKITRYEMENQYKQQWKDNFAGRLKIGRIIQKIFGKEVTTNIFIRLLKSFPFMVDKIVKATHGKEF